ncbi:MAG: flagellin [Chitinivibrionia bacterium]|nr:flagellin [Chitinivibrionia bacterium]
MRIENSGGSMRLGAQQKNISGAMEQTDKQLRKVLEKLATGQRINKASDDAAGLAISEGLLTQTRGFKMAGRNTMDGISALNIADGAANESANILQRQRELAAQSRNATLNDNDRQALNREFQHLSQELERIAESTNFNGQKVANGTGLAEGDAQLQVGPNEGDTVNTAKMDISPNALGLSGMDISTAAGANAAFSSIDGAIQTLGEQRSNVGALTNRLESTIRNLQTADVNTTAAQSVIRDQDMAMGIAEMVKNQVLNQSASNTFSVFNRISADHILGLIK